MRSFLVRATVVAMMAIFAPALPIAASPAAAAESTGTGVSYTLEGCRASTDAYLSGTFICPTANYTTGNLGKGWNEFDLVPGRATVTAGNSAPSSQSFAFVVAVDNCSTTDGATTCSGYPGYDRLSTPVLNTDLSSASGCGSAVVSGALYKAPGIGGTGTTLYRQVSVSGQAKNTTCVYDFYARLAFNSHLYPGSSLHFNLANTDLGVAGIGSKDVSIPVKEILAPGFSKTQTSSRGSNVVWSIGKSSTPATVSFTQTCPSSSNPQSHSVVVAVTWTKSTTASGAVTIQATISLQNNAHRSIDVDVSDQLYVGSPPSSGTAIDAPQTDSVTLAAGASTTLTDTWSETSSATSFSDRATATFKDTVFQETLGTATTEASSTVQTLDPTSGATATIQDVESMTGSTDFDFSVDSVSGVAGSFSDYPTLGAHTRGPVTWNSGTVSSSGSTTFNKTVYVNAPTTGSATLSDTATMSPAGQTTSTAGASSTITGGATVSITISKTMNLTFATAKVFSFTATGTDASTGSTSITIPAGSNGPVTGTISNLHPGVTYTVDEAATDPFGPQSFTATVNLPSCSTTQSIQNTAAPAAARVLKTTNPTGSTSWVFTLTGVKADGVTPVSDLGAGSATSEQVTDTANDGLYTTFTSNLDQDGATYTITETPQTNWDLTSVSGDVDGTAARVSTSLASRTCSFTLNLTTDSLLSCSFANTERARVRVIKTENGGVPTHAYSFRLTGPNSFSQTLTTNGTNLGTLDYGYLVPGSYTLCELAVPAGTASTLETAYGGTVNATTGDICLTFTLAAGVDRDFTIDNSYPGGGQRTIGYWKHWNSYTLSCDPTACPQAIRTGNHLMDEFLPQPLGGYTVDTAAKGVAVLSNPSSKYAENQLAAQLLAAELNKAAGASICTSVTNAITTANSLLTQVGYAGPPSYIVGSKHPLRAQFVSTASLLNDYNNGLVC